MRTLKASVIAFSFLKIISLDVSAFDPDSTLNLKTSSFIPNYMGLVKMVRGNVIAGERELGTGSKVYVNDLIKTSEKSLIVLELIDLTVITLGPSSEFKVEKWAYRTSNDRDAIFSIIKGQWRAHIKSKSKNYEQIQIKTPMVSMGVRGTELLINVMEQLHKEITQVALLEGLIHLYGNNIIKDQDLKPGEHLVLIKTPQGFEGQNKLLSSKEMSSNGPLLLEPIAMNIEEPKKAARIEEIQDKEGIQNYDEKLKPWKDNLKELNKAIQNRLK